MTDYKAIILSYVDSHAWDELYNYTAGIVDYDELYTISYLKS